MFSLNILAFLLQIIKICSTKSFYTRQREKKSEFYTAGKIICCNLYVKVLKGFIVSLLLSTSYNKTRRKKAKISGIKHLNKSNCINLSIE